MTAPAESPSPSTAALDAGWQAVLDRWEDLTAHRAFLALAASLGALPEAGRRYRAIRDTDPDEGRRARATAQLDAVTALALQSLANLKAPPPTRAKRRLAIVAFVFMLTMFLAVVYAYLRTHS